MDDQEFKAKTRGKVYKRRDEAGREVVGLDLGLRGRHIERRRRCQNCMWFDTEEAFDAHFQACVMRDAKILRDRGATGPVVAAQGRKLEQAILHKRGMVGYCTKRIVRGDDAARDDFTSAGYLCDTWSGAHGLRFGREEGPIDKLPAEILDDRGEALPPRPDATPEATPATPDATPATPKEGDE